MDPYKIDFTSMSLNQVITDLCQHPTIDEEMVGYGGTKSVQYQRFEYLMRFIKNEEFIEYLHSPYPILRAYSFWALVKRDYQGTRKLYTDILMNDHARMLHYDACDKMGTTVSLFARSRINM
ncbi:MAG TPA: hypothetical protein PLE75_04595 [Ferruginibacter sp.]|nr:hypothetical protein [Ferruginibacter sp.]HRO97168.1 hypothetical protein [Ferruginibacter sp.]